MQVGGYFVCRAPISPRAQSYLFPGNDYVPKSYFWKGPTMGHPKMCIFNLASGGSAFYMQISSAITGNFIFMNISANINHIQIIIVSITRFSWLRNILRPFSDRSYFQNLDLWAYKGRKGAKICPKWCPKHKIDYY